MCFLRRRRTSASGFLSRTVPLSWWRGHTFPSSSSTAGTSSWCISEHTSAYPADPTGEGSVCKCGTPEPQWVHQPAHTWLGCLRCMDQGLTAQVPARDHCLIAAPLPAGAWASWRVRCLQGTSDLECTHAAPVRAAALARSSGRGEQRGDVMHSRGPANSARSKQQQGIKVLGWGSSSGIIDSSGMFGPCKSRSSRTAAPQEASRVLGQPLQAISGLKQSNLLSAAACLHADRAAALGTAGWCNALQHRRPCRLRLQLCRRPCLPLLGSPAPLPFCALHRH